MIDRAAGQGVIAAASMRADGEGAEREPAPVKRSSLAGNTLIMSLRTVMTISMTLFSSRIILAELGAADFGIYFAVAGVTLVVGFLNSALSTSTQRFLNVALAQEDAEGLRKIFSASLEIHLALAAITVLVSETLGLWLVTTHMVMPPERMVAAEVAFHLAVASTALTIAQVPFNATLVAFERFGAYSAFDIIHAVLRLLVAVLLIAGSGDLLILFSALMFGVTLVVALAKAAFCLRFFPSSRFRMTGDRSLLLRLTSFAGWSLFGAAALVLSIQGVGLLLNLFFGPVANAVQSIALQLTNATSSLSANLLITSNPPIIKSYAAGNRAQFHALVEKSARFSFLLMLLLTAPFIVGTNTVLRLWLETVPPQTTEVTRLLLLGALVHAYSYPLLAASQATGNIKLFQILVSAVTLLAFPIGYLLFSLGAGPLAIFQLLVVLAAAALWVRLVLLKRLTGLDVGRFASAVIAPTLAIAAGVLLVGWAFKEMVPAGMTADLAAMAVTGLATVVASYLIGLSPDERQEIGQLVASRLARSTP